MKSKDEIVQRIKSCYIGDNCVQIAWDHSEGAITVLDDKGIVYHKKTGSSFYVNNFANDERRKKFPYNTISEFNTRKNGQSFRLLLDYNKNYFIIFDGNIYQYYVVKDKENALFVQRLIKPTFKSDDIFDSYEAQDIFNASRYNLDGSIRTIATNVEDTIVEVHKAYIRAQRDFEKQALMMRDSKTGQNIYSMDYISKKFGKMKYDNVTIDNFFDYALDNITIKDIDDHFDLPDNIMISTKDDKIESINGVDITFMEPNSYKIQIYDYPIKIYNYEKIKKLEKSSLVRMKKVKISRKLNPNIDRGEIKRAKQMVKSMKKNSR